MTNLSPLFRVFLIVCLMVVAFTCVQGCATAVPYVELGIGYQLEGMSDPLVRTKLPDQCSKNMPAFIEVGVDYDNGCSLSYSHQSWVLCGKPFNDRPEMTSDYIKGSCKIKRWW